jgi:phosphate transport system substrate-binding protein
MRLLMMLLFLTLASCTTQFSNTLKIKGSDTEVNLAVLFAEDFHTIDAKTVVSVSGGGSGLGIASLLNGNADIANSSRSIKAAELRLFHEKNIAIDSFIFAIDAVAFVVSSRLPIDSISVHQIAKVVSGEFQNWSSLCNSKLPINIYGRQSNSGTHDYVKQALGVNFSPQAKQMNGNAQILEAVKADNSGIGYVGAGYVMAGTTNGIKVLRVYDKSAAAASPLNASQVASGAYFFQRPLMQYFRKKDSLKVRPFFDFEKSARGRQRIVASGYYLINPPT